MAIIVRKDIGIGEIREAYVTLNVGWSSENGGTWQVSVRSWASKEARELNVIQEWIQFRLGDVSNAVPFNETYSQKWGIDKEHWDEMTSLGPWDNAEDLDYLRENYINRGADPVQEYSSFFYDKESPKGVPSSLDTSKMKKHFYKAIQDTSSPLFNVINTYGIDNKDIKKSIKDDMETKKDVILRLAKKDPLLTVLAPSESVLMFPPDWE